MFIIWWWCYRHLAVGEHAVGILGTFIRYFGVVFFLWCAFGILSVYTFGILYGVSVGHLIISDTNFLETYVWCFWFGFRERLAILKCQLEI